MSAREARAKSQVSDDEILVAFSAIFLRLPSFFSVRTSEEKRPSEEDDARIIRDVFFGLLSRLNSLFFVILRHLGHNGPYSFSYLLHASCGDVMITLVSAALSLSRLSNIYIYMLRFTQK